MWHVTNLPVTRSQMPDSNDVGRPTGSPDSANISKEDEGNTTVTDSRPGQPAEELLEEPDLLTQAREFLSSPAIRPQSVSRKREFLLKKGLSLEQTEKLLEEADVRQSHLVRSLGLMAAGAAPTAGSSSNISTTAAAFTASRTSCVPCENNRDFGRCVRSRALDLSCMFDTWTMGFTFPAELTFSNFTWIVLNISSFVGFVCRATRFEKASS